MLWRQATTLIGVYIASNAEKTSLSTDDGGAAKICLASIDN